LCSLSVWVSSTYTQTYTTHRYTSTYISTCTL
jgi:hypothetical protein